MQRFGTMGAACVMAVWLALPAAAQERQIVAFAPGTSGATVTGALKGHRYVDHVLSVQAGQRIEARLEVTGGTGDGTAYFNILPAGQDAGAIYTGSMDDDGRAEVRVPHGGRWALRVYLMGNDRDAGRAVAYALHIHIPPGAAGHAQKAPAHAAGNAPEAAARAACVAAVRAETGNPKVSVERSEFSQAGTEVILRVGPRGQWRCIGYRDGSTDGITSLTDEGAL